MPGHRIARHQSIRARFSTATMQPSPSSPTPFASHWARLCDLGQAECRARVEAFVFWLARPGQGSGQADDVALRVQVDALGCG